MLRVNQQTLYRGIREGKLSHIKVCGSIRFREQDIRSILNGSSKETKSEGKDLKGVYIVLDANIDKVIKVCSRQDRASDYVQIYKKENKETYVKWFKVYKNITK